MISIKSAADINWNNLEAVAYENEPLEISDALLVKIDQGRQQFLDLISQAVPCYGVTTGLGQLVKLDLDDAERADLAHNILSARAAAIGKPFSKPVARGILFLRLVNFLSARDGVTSDLCRFLVDRLNDNFTPWIPMLGHGMAADAIANTHAFQTFIGEGFVYGTNDSREDAAVALAARNAKPCRLAEKEGLALLNGITAAPAYAFDAFRSIEKSLNLATLVSAVSIDALAAPKDAYHFEVGNSAGEFGVKVIIDDLQQHLRGSEVKSVKLQAPVSYRVIPQVHGALFDVLISLRERIESTFSCFSDNPVMLPSTNEAPGQFLSVGLFHNQHLVNQVEQVAIALAHVGCLSERRLHRLLNPENSGLNAQLAARPGLDAGLVVTQKASLDLAARLRLLAQPVSLYTSESSAGQEDYMSMAIPAIQRLYEMVDLTNAMLAYELLAGLVATRQRDQPCGQAIEAVREHFANIIRPLDCDRSPGPDVELILEEISSDGFNVFLGSLKSSTQATAATI